MKELMFRDFWLQVLKSEGQKAKKWANTKNKSRPSPNDALST